MDRLRALLEEDRTRFYGITIKGNSILHIAASLGNDWPITEACNNFEWDLLQHQNLKGDTSIHCAARAGHDRILSLLIDHQEVRQMTEMQNRRGDSALHEAARGGHANAVRQLLAVGENMASRVNEDGESPLYLATVRGSVEAVQMLLGCVMVDCRGPRGQTALHAAVCRSYDIAKMLLEKKPELYRQGDASHSAPIHYAASLRDVKMVSLLLQVDATVAHLLDDKGLSAIHIAASKDYANVIEEILHHCPDANELTDGDGNNFLHVATKKRAKTVMQLALRNPLLRQNINEIDCEGNTPLHLAAMNHYNEIILLLLSDSRVNKNVINREGLTPLDVISLIDDSKYEYWESRTYMVKKLNSAGSKFGPRRMDIVMDKDQQKSEEELKEYRTRANNMAIVSVLIATVAFTAAFTLPGGYYSDSNKQEQGMAILAKDSAFKLFLICDTIAMACSICVTFMLGFSDFADRKRRWRTISLAYLLMYLTLFCILLAFSMGIVLVVGSQCPWLPFLVFVIVFFVPYIVLYATFF
ncbi:hypothetical protein M5K25_002935 [Dendrobium thyrsiflorum]|uniref:PGG domain-containing protein n=1 Tax=Dendrobium thyrsiflorum TaxID=117978 RepID=A0ABD0VW75_DENTH